MTKMFKPQPELPLKETGTVFKEKKEKKKKKKKAVVFKKPCRNKQQNHSFRRTCRNHECLKRKRYEPIEYTDGSDTNTMSSEGVCSLTTFFSATQCRHTQSRPEFQSKQRITRAGFIRCSHIGRHLQVVSFQRHSLVCRTW